MIIIKVKGGLGNQMWQYAFYRSLKEEKKDVYLDLSWFDKGGNRPLDLWRAFDLPVKSKSTISDKSYMKLMNQPCLMRLVNRILHKISHYQICKNNYNIQYFKEKEWIKPGSYYNISEGILDGYWQNLYYFKNIQQNIHKIFVFKKFNEDKVNEIERYILNSKGSASLHWRRGDYVGHKRLGLNLEKYFLRALKHLKQTINLEDVFVFTEDYDYVHKMLLSYNLDLNYIYVTQELNTTNHYYEPYLMSICDNNIISNSTFSWWAAYLNKNVNKIVISPAKWLNNSEHNLIDHKIPSSWIKMPI